ncbi:hypothetical protein GCM10025858_30280 [Alicyclobacillus sacchari]|nr:hypothetical protein GCM10025858_30280 [Alicyclobacillus sacchari]
MIAEHGVPVPEILAITFTNKAAREMKERVRTLIGQRADDLWMGTFHSICVRILRREAEALGYTSSFSILDSDDQEALIAQCLLDLNCDLKTYDPRAIGSRISFGRTSCATRDPSSTSRLSTTWWRRTCMSCISSACLPQTRWISTI